MTQEAKQLTINFLLAGMIVTLIAGVQIKETPLALANDTVASPSPISTTSNIKVGEVHIRPVEKKNYITVKVSHYWPDLGGVNCLTFVDGKCISKMANGQTWQSGVDKGTIACPKELPFNTKIKILGKVYTCRDRGSAIVKTKDGAYWVDMLQKEAIVPYGAEYAGEIL